MDTEKCTALLCVIESGSITAVAEKLGYTVSGVSRMMAAMETESGFPLLVRSKSGVVPTEDCKRILPTVKELARLGGLYEERTSAVRGLETGVIRVGSVYSTYYDWLAKTIVSFSSLHPGFEIRFLQGNSSEFYSSLAEHEVDFCIVSRREGDYDFFPLRCDPLVAWVPKNHPRVKDGFYPLVDFETEPYIETYPGQETDNERAFRENGLSPLRFFSNQIFLTTVAKMGTFSEVPIFLQAADPRPLSTDCEYCLQNGRISAEYAWKECIYNIKMNMEEKHPAKHE